MGYDFKVLTQEQAEDIAHNWHYEDVYSFYDMEADQEDLEEFVDPASREKSGIYGVFEDEDLIGFFSFHQEGNSVDIGLGMRPDLTGKGDGLDFLLAGMDFAEKKYAPQFFTLSVATFNERAIKVYGKAGFQAQEKFMQDTNGDRYEFLKMKYTCCSLKGRD